MTYIPEMLRRVVSERAELRCEYCYLHEDNAFYTREIDHIYAEKHGGQTDESNLCLACADCNRHKGSDICSLDQETGEVVSLYHPRHDTWDEHFALNSNGLISPLTAKARVTERILRFNRIDLTTKRARLIELGRY